MQRNFNDLSPDLLRQFAVSYLAPQDMVSLSAVNKYLHESLTGRNAQLLWRFKLQQHFPDVYDELVEKNNCNYYAAFMTACSTQYKYLKPRQKWLVTCIKEGDIKSLQNGRKKNDAPEDALPDFAPVSFNDFHTHLNVNGHTTDIFNIAASGNNQSLLDYLYSMILESNKDAIAANPNAVLGSDKKQLIHYACCFNQSSDIVTALIASGANVNVGDKHNSTPLHEVVRLNRLEQVKFLLKNAANVDVMDFFMQKPLYIAFKHRYLDILVALLEKVVNLNGAIFQSTTLLHLAVKDGDTGLVLFLLGKGVDVNVEDLFYQTPLHLAIRKGHIEIFNALLATGVDVNAANDFSGNSLLHCAVMNGRLDTIQALLAHGANVNALCVDDATPLHFAVRYGRLDVVQILLANGAHADALRYDGLRPINIAIQRGYFIMALRLYAYEVKNRPDNHRYSFVSPLLFFSIYVGKSAGEKKDAVSALLAVVENGADIAILTPHLPALQNGRLGEIFKGLGFDKQSNGDVVRMQRRT